jgi:hypothetical protein
MNYPNGFQAKCATSGSLKIAARTQSCSHRRNGIISNGSIGKRRNARIDLRWRLSGPFPRMVMSGAKSPVTNVSQVAEAPSESPV